MVQALRRQMRWTAFGSEGNPLQQYHLFRPFVHWYNTRQMDNYITPRIDAQLEMQRTAANNGDNELAMTQTRSIINLALTTYLRENPKASSLAAIDPVIKDIAVNQMKLFLYSGHDTTSSSVCYVLYLLSTHSAVLARTKKEHNDVLGSDPTQAATSISKDPYVLNRLPYTTAVIKETLRLFPRASSTRSGEPDFSITDPPTGLKYPAPLGTLIWLPHHATHRDPAFWPQADDFLPERWLVQEGEGLCPKPGAWRPFEHGPRSCIGKELSMAELKIVVCLVVRRFEICPAYDELDAKEKGALRTVNGERAYQVGKGEPSEWLPCRVKVIGMEA